MSTWLGECEGSAGIKGAGLHVAASHVPRAIPSAQQVCRAAVAHAEGPAPSSPRVLLHKPWTEGAISHLPCALMRRGRATTMVKLLQLTPCAHPSNCQHP